MALVWAYKRLHILNNATGFVTTDDQTAKNLIESGDVQDPRIGASALKHVEDDYGYSTKVMMPAVAIAPAPVKRKKAKDAT